MKGVSETDARRPLLQTSPQLTLAGLVRHLTAVERAWFRIVMAEESVEDLATPVDPKAMEVPPGVGLDALLSAYEQECAAASRAVADVPLDATAAVAGRRVSLRWVLLHMIEETARHNGHADLLRERIDGTTGD